MVQSCLLLQDFIKLFEMVGSFYRMGKNPVVGKTLSINYYMSPKTFTANKDKEDI